MKTISWHWFMDKRFMNAILFFGLIALGTACTDDSDQNSPSSNGSADKGKVGTFDAPIVSCVEDPAKTTQTSITVRVTAGNSGAPAGFSLQWLTKTEYDLNGWGSAVLCKASFSGNANEHVFNLSPNGYIDVTLGDVLFDTPGASSDCIFDLECGTEYVFRAFAHATSTMFKSGWSANQICSTESCVENCVYGQGYWQRHGPVPPGQSEILYIWPQDVKDNGMMLGTVHYTAAQLQDINYATGATNGLVKLAHQLIAAKLNIANGADGTSIAATIASADALIGSRVIPPVGSGSLTNAQVAALNEALTAYNEGDGGVEFCADEED